MRTLFMNLFILFILSFSINNLQSQTSTEFWGMTANGGDGFGVIFSTDGNGDNLQCEHIMGHQAIGSPIYTHLCEAQNGKLYGMTSEGVNSGVIYEYDPATAVFEIKAVFNGSGNGAFPTGSLVLASNGLLYGMTRDGGLYNDGVLFEFNPTTSVLIKKFDFDNTVNGGNPMGSLIQADNGKLYGMTKTGGTENTGVIFEYDLSTDSLILLHSFLSSTADGHTPFGSLIQNTDGKLFGMTLYGGINDYGTIFSLNTDGSDYSKLFEFDSTVTGAHPEGSLMLADNGHMYGLTAIGGSPNSGTLFEFDPDSVIFIKRFNFNSFFYGAVPRGTLMQASNGKLYGMTCYGNSDGYIFEFDPISFSYSIRHSFYDSPGAMPMGSLMQASNGKLYGMTRDGGCCGNGVLFEFDLIDFSLSTPIDFSGLDEGGFPYGSLVQASNGKLYGLTYMGGSQNNGTLFEFNPDSSLYKFISFDPNVTIGKYPIGSLTQAPNGRLYGTTISGGLTNSGIIFEFYPNNFTISNKYTFITSAYGESPNGSMTLATNGKLYGLTKSGGIYEAGVLFEYDPNHVEFYKLYDFISDSGSSPRGSVIQASNFKFYGVTESGGSHGLGVLFEYDLSASTYTVKYNFDGGICGSEPSGSLIQGSNGKLYGLAVGGGQNNMGVLFEYNIVNGNMANKFSFDGTDHGRAPRGTLMLASNGNMYGLTNVGGVNDLGVLFEFNPSTGVCIKKADFTGANGASPMYTQLIEINKTIGIEEASENGFDINVYPNPASEQLCIELPDLSDYQVAIYTLPGKSVQTCKSNHAKTVFINIADLAPGMYLVKIGNTQTSVVKRIVIER